jgi:hypothetical protein
MLLTVGACFVIMTSRLILHGLSGQLCDATCPPELGALCVLVLNSYTTWLPKQQRRCLFNEQLLTWIILFVLAATFAYKTKRAVSELCHVLALPLFSLHSSTRTTTTSTTTQQAAAAALSPQNRFAKRHFHGSDNSDDDDIPDVDL